MTFYIRTLLRPPRRRSDRAFASQVETAPLQNAQQQVRVPRVLGDDHYKRIHRVTLGIHLKKNHCSMAMRAELMSNFEVFHR